MPIGIQPVLRGQSHECATAKCCFVCAHDRATVLSTRPFRQSLRVLIPGMDGYIGWSLALHLAKRGHDVYGIDNFSRRKAVEEMGSWSALPILDIEDRIRAAKQVLGVEINFMHGSLLDYPSTSKAVRESSPDAIVHLGEQPSAPYSMIDRAHAFYTQENNTLGTLNLLFAMKEHARNAHLVKLGTMGEYGTPNVDIPEGFFEVEYRGRKDRLPFPRQAGSFYHWSKVNDSGNVMFACKLWNLRSTDVMQGVVYGTRVEEMTDDRLSTRFDFDEAFGTAINRFCSQAVIGYPLTPYGKAGQTRGFIALVDSVQCLTIAVENAPEKGEYRVFNQLDEVYSVSALAKQVSLAAKKLGINTRILGVENPRMEQEQHYYRVDHEKLRNLGFRATRTLRGELQVMLQDLIRHRERIKAKEKCIRLGISWKTGLSELATPVVPERIGRDGGDSEGVGRRMTRRLKRGTK